jgi:hypothetical protein
LSSTTSIRRPASVLPVPGRPLGLVYGDVPAVHAEVAQEPGQHVAGRYRVRGRAEQVDVQLAVGEAAAYAVGGVHGQRGLAEPARARHHRDADRAGITARRLARMRQQLAQPLHLLVPPGEVGNVGRQLRRGRRSGAAPAIRLVFRRARRFRAGLSGTCGDGSR